MVQAGQRRAVSRADGWMLAGGDWRGLHTERAHISTANTHYIKMGGKEGIGGWVWEAPRAVAGGVGDYGRVTVSVMSAILMEWTQQAAGEEKSRGVGVAREREEMTRGAGEGESTVARVGDKCE